MKELITILLSLLTVALPDTRRVQAAPLLCSTPFANTEMQRVISQACASLGSHRGSEAIRGHLVLAAEHLYHCFCQSKMRLCTYGKLFAVGYWHCHR